MSHRITSLRRAGAVVVAAASLVVASSAMSPAPAAAAGAFTVTLTPASNGGGTATLSDTILPANQYLLTLTSTGSGTCTLTGPTVQIADFDVRGFANPVSATVSGACALYNAVVAYTVTWTGVTGTSGQFPVVCTWVLGLRRCTTSTFSLPSPI